MPYNFFKAGTIGSRLQIEGYSGRTRNLQSYLKELINSGYLKK